MYLQHFGLRSFPFEMTPNSSVLFMTEQHREALAGIGYAIVGRKGIAVVTGEAGTGKTTILARSLQHLPADRVRACTIMNPLVTAPEFLELVLMAFQVDPVPASKPGRLKVLEHLLTTTSEQGRIAALVIDEAHLLSPPLLEEIRLLGNYEAGGQKLLQIVLAGQPPLADLLNREDLFQFKQRVAIRVSLSRLRAVDIESYIRFRWTRAGGPQALPFGPEAIELIARASSGIPRIINAICDNALMAAMGSTAPWVTASHVAMACHDLDLKVAAPQPAPAVAPEARMAAATASAGPDPRHAAAGQRAEPAPGVMPTLFRYAPPGRQKLSFLNRWAEKLGLAG